MDNDKEKNSIDRRDFLGLAGTALLGATAGSATASQAAQELKPPKQRFRIIDTHFHMYNTKLQGINGIPRHFAHDAYAEYELSVMDAGGVDKAFLITYRAEDFAGEIQAHGMSPVALKPVVDREYQIGAWQAHKDRFWWFPDGVNPIHEHFLEDVEHDFDAGASGIKLLPMFMGLLPDNAAWLPVYELCRKRRKPIIIDWSWWYVGGNEVGYGFNESRERQELCKSYRSFADWAKPMDPIFAKFADVQISLAHCGTPKNRDDYEHIFAFIARHPNLHCDLAALPDYNPWFIEKLVKAVGPRKVMYGTDVPHWLTGLDSYRLGERRWGVIADDCFFLSDEEKQLILAGNAERFLKFER